MLLGVGLLLEIDSLNMMLVVGLLLEIDRLNKI